MAIDGAGEGGLTVSRAPGCWQAITSGFKDSIEEMQTSCGLNPAQVVEMMLMVKGKLFLERLSRILHQVLQYLVWQLQLLNNKCINL